MFYTINNTINFRDTDGLIWLDHDEASSITLTTTTSRLLAFLLEKQGEVVSRDDILSQVWDAHGLRSSNNSLNKYISDLRTIFRNMGYSEEIIITVPRIGFMFSADATVEKHTLDHPQQTFPAVLIEDEQPKKRRGPVLAIITGLLIFALLLIVKGSVFINQHSSDAAGQKTWPVGNIASCNVFAFTPASTETTQLKLAIVNDILQKEKLTCTPDTDIYFQAAEPILYGSPGRVFLSLCRSSDRARTQFSSCYNFYETAYERKK